MQLGYMRTSKADGSQALDLQRDALLASGVEEAHLYQDQASGRRDDRPGLAACLKALRRGDVLVAWKLDRLGRDLRHLVNLVHELTGRGVGLKVLTGQGATIDTTTPAGKLVFGIFAALAEFERELIVERTRAGLASARARGRTGGRPYKMTGAKLRLAMAAMGQPGTKVADLCRELGVTRQTLYRHVGPQGALRPDGERLLALGPVTARRGA
jgi:DNA invertase Pin-like site-specific DNA recombinase